jgi:Flp pilus assembly protein CpaB
MEYAQRLISTRRGAILVAALAAIIAGILIVAYVQRYRNSVNSEGAPVTVLVAKQAIAKGTSGTLIATTGLYSATTIRQSQLLNGAFSDASSLRDKVATRDIYQGSQLKATDFAPAATDVAASLTQHQRIIAVPFDATHGDTANIQAGDHVDVYALFNLVSVNSAGIPTGTGAAHTVLRMIMSNVNVQNVGKAGSGAGTFYFKVTDTQATKLAFAADNGRLWLALRPAAGAKTAPPSVVTIETLMLGVSPQAVYSSLGGRK